MQKGRKGQFYLIAAVIIIVIIISMAAITNYVSTKQEPKKFFELGEILKSEGRYIIDSSVYKNSDVNTNIENYLRLYADYMEANTNEDFNLIVLYGSTTLNTLQGKLYSKSSTGNVSVSLGGTTPVTAYEGEEVRIEDADVTVTSGNSGNVHVQVNSGKEGSAPIEQDVPVLADNNFVFIMTTSSGFNEYVQNSFSG